MLPVAEQAGVRPTPNRVRETLFNWLQGRIEGSNCLDLFAGSGALGFESSSRGATKVTLVDNSPAVIDVLKEQVFRLHAKGMELVCSDGPSYLAESRENFDIVFLDPPFQQFSLEQLLQKLAGSRVLKKNAMIYLESPPGKLPVRLPDQWQWWRQSRASQVEYGLITTE